MVVMRVIQLIYNRCVQAVTQGNHQSKDKRGMKRRAKTKGKPKGNLKGKSDPKKKCSCNCGCKSPKIPTSFELNLRGEYSLIGVIQLEERLRRIVREELDKTTTITPSDFLGNAHEKMEKTPRNSQGITF